LKKCSIGISAFEVVSTPNTRSEPIVSAVVNNPPVLPQQVEKKKVMIQNEEEDEKVKCPICSNKFFPNEVENHVNSCLDAKPEKKQVPKEEKKEEKKKKKTKTQFYNPKKNSYNIGKKKYYKNNEIESLLLNYSKIQRNSK